MEAKRLTEQVFLSHTRNEQDLADAIASVLAERGVNVWDQQEMTPGADRDREVSKALKQSDSMIALLTPHSFSSSWVRTELEYAFFDDRYKHRLLPVMIGGKAEDFVRLPWILDQLNVLRLRRGEPTRRRAKRIVEAFLELLKESAPGR